MNITYQLSHWCWVTHICVSELAIIDSDNGLSPERRKATIWTSAGIFLIGPLRTNVSEISIAVQTFSFKKMHLKMSSAKWRPLFLGPNVCTREQEGMQVFSRDSTYIRVLNDHGCQLHNPSHWNFRRELHVIRVTTFNWGWYVGFFYLCLRSIKKLSVFLELIYESVLRIRE